MKYLLVVLVALAIAFGFMIKHSNDKRAEIAEKQRVERIEKLRKQKVEELLKQGLDVETSEKLLKVREKANQEQVKEIVSTLSRWTDSVKLASSTPRIGLSQPISQLQEIKRTLSQREFTDECSKVLQDTSLIYMDYGIDAFIEFLKDNEYTADRSLEQATEQRKTVQAVIHYCEMDL